MFTSEEYFASKDPRVAAVHSLPFPEREGKAAELDAAGLVIDRAIDIYGWDPVAIMVTRAQLGYPWVPNAFQPNLVDPLFHQLPGSTDMTKPWDRSIKVSVDEKDYPAFVPPPAPVPAKKLVGPFIGNGAYGCDVADVSHNGVWLFRKGDKYTQDGKDFYFNLGFNIMGPSPFWQDTPITN